MVLVRTALADEPALLVAVLLSLLAGIFWLCEQPWMRRVTDVLHPIMWIYFVPMLLGSFGLLPRESGVYSAFSQYLLPFALFLLTLTIDLRAIAKLGRPAVIVMAAGALGVAVGAVAGYSLFKDLLPANGWQGMASLSASWIGGSANMVAVQQGLQAPASILGPLIVVDSGLGYSLLGVYLALAGKQAVFDRWLNADPKVLEAVTRSADGAADASGALTTSGLAQVLGLGAAAAAAAVLVAGVLPAIGDPVIISKTSWTLLIVVSLGMLASLTRLRRLEQSGASSVGYAGLFLLLASVGAQGNLFGLMEAPAYIGAALVMMAFHLVFTFGAARWVRAPMALVVSASIANVGGSVSAPAVAGAYNRALVPVALLLALAGYLGAVYIAFGIAQVLAMIAGA